MSIIKEEYRDLPPKGEKLSDVVVLAQAWKKSHTFIRRHNWYADVLELDASTIDHHLFPRQYLKKHGVESVRDINQIANYALVEWDDNIAISDGPPSAYWPEYAKRFTKDELVLMSSRHALPANWWELSYEDFLKARRPLIAGVIRAGYQRLLDEDK